MMRISLLICDFLVVFITSVAEAQPYSSVHYDTKDGLPSATVYDISQDINGFIWFATENGLGRFDGKNFRNYTTKDGLPDNSILKVHADNNGRVFFTPFTRGLSYYHNDSFFTVPIPDKYKAGFSVIEVFFNRGGDIVMSGQTGCFVIDSTGLHSFADLYHQSRIKGLVRAYDNLIIASDCDSVYFITRSGKTKSIRYPAAKNSGFIFDDSMKFQQIGLENRPSLIPRGFLRNNLNWDNSADFLFIYDNPSDRLLYKIPIDKVSNAFIDNENNLWVATLGNGIYRFPSFGFHTIDFGGKNEIFSLVKYKDKMIAGTEFSKMFTISLADDNQPFNTDDFSVFNESSTNPIPRTTKRNRIYSLYSDDKDLYIGTDAFLLRKKGTARPIFRNIHPVKDIDVRDQEILICTGRDVLKLDRASLNILDTLLGQRATCGAIYHGDYYIGTLGGLIKINSKTRKITNLYDSLKSLTGRITSIKRGINDDMWIATSGHGLIHYRDGKILDTLTESDGLTSDICTCLFIDSNLIWLGSNNGLNRIDVTNAKARITRFTSANGLSADFINAIYATDSTVYVGTAAGITSFKKGFLTEKSICILHVLGVSENSKKLKVDSSYSFPFNTLNIQVDFTAISFKSAGDITYSYRLEGLDDNWNTTTANFVNFSALPPGNYTLLLKASNKFGVESNLRKLKIRILPPWWQTWTFITVALLTIALFVLFLYRYNIRKIKQREAAKREIEARFAALEQQALQAQMNPHFIFNCLNSIQTFILNFDAEGANNYLTTFASLIRQTLDNSMQPLISVASELKYLETYLDLEKLRFRDKFRYVIYVDDDIDITNTMLPGMLLQPYVENSLRHGIQHRKDNEGLISVNVKKTEDHGILYTIRDNGVGRKKAVEMRSTWHIEYQSRGTSINEKRISAINNQYNTNIWVKTADIIDEKAVVAGTLVTVYIPPFHK